MSGRNAFFASVFSMEVDRWQRETGKTLAEFASLIDAHPNNIGRYKKGAAFPSPYIMGRICDTLKVDESIFYPSTPQDLVKYDPDFRKEVIESAVEESLKNVENIGIDRLFYAYCIGLPNFIEIFPFSDKKNEENAPFAFANCNNLESLTKFNKQDLELIKTLQLKVNEYMIALLCKEKYDRERRNTNE